MDQLSPALIATIILGYFFLLIAISFFTSRNTTDSTFFTGDRSSPWLLVAIGMIGASLSGVTFISVPGLVGAGGKNQAFSYMQMVIGYLFGYAAIAYVLMPIYYRLGLTSIYEYLGRRLGRHSHWVGAFYFLLSRIVGASFRLFLVAIVLQKFLMDSYGIPFEVTVLITIGLIWVYTFSGGIKTIVVTDVLQTVCMLVAVVLTILHVGRALELDFSGIVTTLMESPMTKVWHTDVGWNDPNNIWKQLLSGALIALVMTGLDQDMMQKNLTCRSLGDAQKNMVTFSIVLVFANLLFLSLGALLYIYAAESGVDVPASTDLLYPTIALDHMPVVVGVVFLLGLIAAAYSSADSALTSLTTAFCIDFLDFGKKDRSLNSKKRIRLLVHIGFSLILLLVVVVTKQLDAKAIINELFVAAGYTYGPMLGLFAYGILTRWQLADRYVIPVCIAAPVLSYILVENSATWLGGFQFGHTIIALNGLLTFIGLLAITRWGQPPIANIFTNTRTDG